MLRTLLKTSLVTSLLLSSAYAYTPVEDAIVNSTNFTVAGTFCSYDFADAPNEYDWTFIMNDGTAYQLLGNPPSKRSAFGWKKVNITPPSPQWYMFQLNGDVDGDGTTKFDWVLVSADPNNPASYKLEGVADNGTFLYSPRLDVNLTVVGDSIHVMNQFDGGTWADTNGTTTHQPIDVTQMATNTLTDAQKEGLLFMYDEEKMARDVYLSLNAINPHRTLENIATRAEQTHMDQVYSLIEKYDLDPQNTLASLPANTFDLPEIQDLYDSLTTLGTPSVQASLEVGCMVEVTDINDLLERMENLEDADDIKTVYSALLSGSYSHYWSFDNALKTLGVTEGCCSVGDAYCKTEQEYPKVSKGNRKH